MVNLGKTPIRAGLWRPMTADDLDDVLTVAARVHPGLPERREVFSERAALFPAGALVLAEGGAIGGYAVAHPIRSHAPPALDTLLGALVADADDLYIHDVAVLPERRGGGAASAAVTRLLALASPYPTSSLVSVYGTAPFWARFGFSPSTVDMADKIRPYGPGAIYMVRHNRGGP